MAANAETDKSVEQVTDHTNSTSMEIVKCFKAFINLPIHDL